MTSLRGSPTTQQVLKRLAAAALAATGDRAWHSGGEAVFLELSGQLDKAEDGLLAGARQESRRMYCRITSRACRLTLGPLASLVVVESPVASIKS